MSFYDAMKDAMNLAQKADNIELYRQLLDLGAQALDLQAEVARLREENAELKKQRNMEERVIRHKEPYITLDGDNTLCYCSHCWDSDHRLIQLICDEEDGTFVCPHCKMRGTYDLVKYKLATRDPDEYQNPAGSFLFI